jgi:hypothetical protein
MNGDLMDDVVTEVSVTGAVTTDGRLRFRSPLDVEAWAHDHLLSRLSWELLIDGNDHGIPREADKALDMVRTEMIPEAVRRTMIGRPSDAHYLTWAVYGLDDKRQVEFLDRAWRELHAYKDESMGDFARAGLARIYGDNG